MYSENLEIISRWAGDVGVRDLDIEMALDFYDQMYPQTPTKANHAMVVLRLLYSFARRRGGTERVSDNPFMKPGLEWTHPKPRIWPPREIAIFASHRSQERRVGPECVSTCGSRRSPYHYKKNKQHN